MNFETFKVKRNEYVEWMTANGFNEGDCRKNGEFTAIEVFSPFFDFFIDIGANVGIFINQLNPKSSKFVLAFEPNPYLRKDLQEKISRGLLVERALSSKKGYAKFHIYNADDTTSSLLDRNDMMPHFTSKVESIDVELDILDGYMPIIEKESSKGIFIKIDAEGVEYPILQGACKVLCRPAPTFLMFEYSNAWKLGGHTLKDAFNLLDALGFKVFRVTPFGLEEFRFYTPNMESHNYCNYFAAKGVDVANILRTVVLRSETHNVNNFYLFAR